MKNICLFIFLGIYKSVFEFPKDKVYLFDILSLSSMRIFINLLHILINFGISKLFSRMLLKELVISYQATTPSYTYSDKRKF